MSEPSAPAPLTPADVYRIEDICDRFEKAWKAAAYTGQAPRLEDVLRGAPVTGRVRLLGKLIRLDLDYRRQRGEQPTAEEYRRRFPKEAAAISGVLEPLPAGPSRPARLSHGSNRNLLFGILALQMDFIRNEGTVYRVACPAPFYG